MPSPDHEQGHVHVHVHVTYMHTHIHTADYDTFEKFCKVIPLGFGDVDSRSHCQVCFVAIC